MLHLCPARGRHLAPFPPFSVRLVGLFTFLCLSHHSKSTPFMHHAPLSSILFLPPEGKRPFNCSMGCGSEILDSPLPPSACTAQCAREKEGMVQYAQLKM
ncbi:hypothetical protein CDAR_521121 [Caerostris darwini]|uniref:Secreted protein n=1 Tax=Caerostris darwini TaxID=1538125 RepID=A0AAV4VAV5_9ARAC|nr:hypothetical protein CDAR_521121 [Caerostris darwini]